MKDLNAQINESLKVQILRSVKAFPKKRTFRYIYTYMIYKIVEDVFKICGNMIKSNSTITVRSVKFPL